MSIHQTILSVMRDIDAIGKDRTNEIQRFKFRGVDDIYNSLHPIMCKHGLFSAPRVVSEKTEDRASSKGGSLIYRVLSIEYDFYNEAGDKLTIGPFIGEAMDSGDKAANKALSIAHKYALIQLFCIPTEDDKDPDATSHTPAGNRYSGVRLQSVDAIKGEDGKTLYRIQTANGRFLTTFSKTLAESAKKAAEAGAAVTITIEQVGEYTNLTGIA